MIRPHTSKAALKCLSIEEMTILRRSLTQLFPDQGEWKRLELKWQERRELALDPERRVVERRINPMWPQPQRLQGWPINASTHAAPSDGQEQSPAVVESDT